MSAICVSCGEALPERARFCPACAAPVATAQGPAASRRVVTVFFSDVAGSTALGERLDPEAVRGVMNRYFAAVSAALERHGGRVEKFIGDAIVALFGVPAAHEDDALRCVRAALEARDAIRTLGDELETSLGVGLGVRIGVTTGEVVIGTAPAGQRVVTGDTMNTAARLEAAAPVGEILIGASTYRLVRDLVEAEPVEALELKGKSERVAAFRAVAVREAAAARPWAAAAMVGRTREQCMLRDAFDRAVEERSCQIVTVVGTAGVGKSRLVGEFLADVQGHSTVTGGRCLSYGEGITYWALAEALRTLAGIEEHDSPARVRQRLSALAGADGADDVGSLLGLAGSTARVEDARIALRGMLSDVAAARPLVLVFDDIHWAEPPLLDLIEYLADWLTEAPVLMLCMARPELLEERADWAGGRLNATTLLLEPLSPADAGLLVAGLLGEGVPAGVADRITAAAEGNPLFVEELIGMLTDDGHLRRGEAGIELVAPIDRVELPATIQSLLTARLDRLSAGELGVVERASIEGQVFHLGALAALGASPETVAPTVRALARQQVFRADQAALPGQDAYSFRHILIREAAYERVAKEVRSRWHEAFAIWLGAQAGERVSEYEELLGHHLAEAARFRVEIGDTGQQTVALARRAATLFRHVADRATVQGDYVAAASLLDRVAALMPVDDPARPLALVDCAGMLVSAGHVNGAVEVLEAAGAAAHASGDRFARLVVESLQRMVDISGRADVAVGEEQAALDAAGAAAKEAERAGRPGEAARLWYVASIWEGNTMLRCARACEAAQRTIELGRLGGSRWQEAFGVVARTMFLLRGRGRIPDLLRAGEEASAPFGRAIRADYLAAAAALLAQRDEADAALDALADAIAIVQELGFKEYIARWAVGTVLLDAGRPMDAIESLHVAAALAGEVGDIGSAASIIGLLARALALSGRMDDAAQRSVEARALSAPSDRWSALLWRGAAVRVHGWRGQAAEARSLADEIVVLVADIDYPGIEFHARLDAAEGYRAAGDVPQAEAHMLRAIADSEERGAHGFARQAREAVDRLRAVAPAPAETPPPTA